MSTGNRIEFPPSTANRLAEWVRQRNEITALIEATVVAAREALGVPEGWVLRDVAEGFVAPEPTQVDAPAGGAMEPVG